MVVYALYDVYFDGCDQWINIVDLYQKLDDAEAAMEKLEQANEDLERQSYYITGLPVL